MFRLDIIGISLLKVFITGRDCPGSGVTITGKLTAHLTAGHCWVYLRLTNGQQHKNAWSWYYWDWTIPLSTKLLSGQNYSGILEASVSKGKRCLLCLWKGWYWVLRNRDLDTGTLCPGKEIHMRLKETMIQSLEEMNRKVSRCVGGGFFGDLRF